MPKTQDEKLWISGKSTFSNQPITHYQPCWLSPPVVSSFSLPTLPCIVDCPGCSSLHLPLRYFPLPSLLLSWQTANSSFFYSLLSDYIETNATILRWVINCVSAISTVLSPFSLAIWLILDLISYIAGGYRLRLSRLVQCEVSDTSNQFGIKRRKIQCCKFCNTEQPQQ